MAIITATYNEIEVHNKPSLYATPLAWAIQNFTRLLIGDHEGIEPSNTGMIVVSDECSLTTIRDLSRTAEQGAISPLKFAGASPSIVAGLAALEYGVRGPTLTLTMPPEHASTAIRALIEYWFRSSAIGSVIVIAHYRQEERRHLCKGFIARSSCTDVRQHVMQLCHVT